MGMRITRSDYDKMLQMLESSEQSSEIEIKIDTDHESRKTRTIDYFQFQRCLSYVSNLFKTKGKNVEDQNVSRYENIMLDITSDDVHDIRLTLTGMDNILYFCRTRKFMETNLMRSINAMHKPKASEKVVLSEYGISIKKTTEDAVQDIGELKKILSDLSKSSKKYFRVKQRYSFYANDDESLRFDFTMVQHSTGRSLDDLTKAFGNMKKTYEIEIEVVDPVAVVDKESTLRSMVNYMTEILQVVDNVEYLMSRTEKDLKIAEYSALLAERKTQGKKMNNSFFAGPQPVTLEKKHFSRPNGEDHVISIFDDYTVSLKADGERHLIFADSRGHLYLLNNRLAIKDTGLTSSKFRNALFDGELVAPRTKENKLHVLLFDAYYINGDSITHLPLIDKKKEGKKKDASLPASFTSRFEALGALVQSIDKENDFDARFVLKVKDFLYPSKQLGITNIFDCVRKMNASAEFVNFHTDGLIFTPASLPVGMNPNPKASQNSAHLQDPSSLTGTWISVLKWKPPEHNTIDFLVRETCDPMLTIDGQSHKTFGLYCGASQSPFSSTANLLINKSRLRQHDSYAPKLFDPVTQLYIDNSNVSVDVRYAHIPVNATGTTNAENGDEILHNTIVEMYFDMENKRWKASRVRMDKTEKYKSTRVISGTANDYDVATKSIWETIVNPITVEHIMGEKEIELSEIKGRAEHDFYYENSGNSRNALTQPMKTFHNQMVKGRSLISKLNGHSVTRVLDPAFGQGGDMKKYASAGITTVVGYDLYSNNIYAKNGGANSRLYAEYIKDDRNPKKVMKSQHPWKYVFLPLDFSTPISKSLKKIEEGKKKIKGEKKEENHADFDDDDLQLLLWGRGKTKLSVLAPLRNIATKPFDAISIQFALHYFFQSKKTVEACLDNIANTLREGGYFIGTCFDGQRVHNTFAQANESILEGRKEGKVIWRLHKKYTGNFDPTSPDLGKTIGVYVETINNRENDEYLVGFDYLITELQKRKIRLANKEECKLLGLSKGMPMGGFQDLYDDMKMYDRVADPGDRWWIEESMQMSEAEKQLSFLYNWFVFRKI